mmetsp:Transcript_19697/g.34947  ORF Transcript_19697/g.34947 Transcript_19697/m.34947 type:complete len:300 (+) Transcript_19697:103-1002(+)
MVNSQMSFVSPDFQTPHGGAPFQGWRKGFGFGHGTGAGGHVLDPGCPQELRFTPKGTGALASSAFWRKKYELGQAASFGIGERPDYGNPRDADIAPNTYGDYSAQLSKVKRNSIRAGIKLKPRFPSVEEKARDMSWPASGPGPAKYNTTIPAGQSSWSRPARNPSFSLGARIILDADLRERMGKPSPGEYNCITKPGCNSAILRGTLYDISLKGRTKVHQPGEASPGPARYQVLGELEQYGLGAKIASVKVPKKKKMEEDEPGPSAAELFGAGGSEVKEEAAAEGEANKSLSRIESSPI